MAGVVGSLNAFLYDFVLRLLFCVEMPFIFILAEPIQT